MGHDVTWIDSPAAASSPGTGAGRAGGGEALVVVGVDASDSSRDALRWAGRYAALTGAPLVVVHAWNLRDEQVWLQPLPPPAPQQAVAREEMAKMVDEDVPLEVTVHAALVEGHATKVLVDTAGPGDLLVVGSHGRGGFDHLVIGSVAAQCVAHARCPVVVVR